MLKKYWTEYYSEDFLRKIGCVDKSRLKELNLHISKVFKNLTMFEKIDLESKYKKFIKENEALLTEIILYHDVGKLLCNFNHEKISYKIVNKFAIGNKLSRLVIKDHLMLGCIFNGEWSVKCLYESIMECEKHYLDVEKYIALLLIISIVDVWAYVEDYIYVTKLFFNYSIIIDSVLKKEKCFVLQENMIWRFAAFCGAYKCVDYMQKDRIEKYAKLINENILSNLHYKGNALVKKMTQINFSYASWMFCRFFYRTLEEYKKLCFEDIKVNANICKIFNDIFSVMERYESQKKWYIFFDDYRGDEAFSEKIFCKLTNEFFINNVLKEKKIKISMQENQIIYNWGGSICTK